MDHVTPRGGPLRAGDPSHIGPYALAGRLGSGGMGVVYLARDPAGRPVAVKVVHAELADDDEFRRRFRSEVERARQVPPFCTAAVLDADPDAPRPYLVVEYVDGPSLFEVVRERGPLTGSHVHSVAIGVATALVAIHDAGIIHRDLKPQNVLLAPGSPKVIDFGIARALEATTEHTSTGRMVGTVAYMAPERFGGTGVSLTQAADIFAWGCVVAFAATGHGPFDADSPVATAARILSQPPDLRGLDGTLRRLVEQALSTDASRRPTAKYLLDALIGSGPQPVTEVLRATEVLQRQPALRGAVDRVHEPARHRRGRRRVWIGVLAALATLLVLGAGALAAARVFDTGTTVDSGRPSPPASFALPEGKVFIADTLTVGGQWNGTYVVGEEESNCDVTDGALRAHRVSPGFFTCSGPEKELAGDHTIEVTGRIEEPGTCLGIWLYWQVARSYQLTACEDAFRLSVDRDGAIAYVVREVELGAPGLRRDTPIRLQVVVRDGVARFGHDGVPVGEAALPEADIDRGRPMIGLVTAPGDESPPWAASFNDVEVRTLSP
ncbi:serine/threonine-protein kinase [Actinoplanes sp. NBRC 103695]|uniref:serine/threonine-protein kinase n=1 Tax=Actinoplanes sp. NBRC 103695 TaxID=3032202 RepID=UPI0025578E5A|nr:serine/threonine-protein kinase [Actinoplanes sp. NBRC 103695]